MSQQGICKLYYRLWASESRQLEPKKPKVERLARFLQVSTLVLGQGKCLAEWSDWSWVLRLRGFGALLEGVNGWADGMQRCNFESNVILLPRQAGKQASQRKKKESSP
jgi:hypothetical protein